MMKIFLIRHASPDWDRRDIPYDIHPGPMLSPKGEKEAEALAEFLKVEGVLKIYYSPFERAARTAKIISTSGQIHAVEDPRLAEWRGVDEPEARVRQRMSAMFDHIAWESTEIGPIGLVSHGGPIAVLLQELGMDRDELARYRTRFDTSNPLPPAGAWKLERDSADSPWSFDLVFTPSFKVS